MSEMRKDIGLSRRKPSPTLGQGFGCSPEDAALEVHISLVSSAQPGVRRQLALSYFFAIMFITVSDRFAGPETRGNGSW